MGSQPRLFVTEQASLGKHGLELLEPGEKVAPGATIKCFAWSRSTGWMALGGERTEGGEGGDKARSFLQLVKMDRIEGKLVLARSESLPYHAGCVEHVVWNEMTPRLVSADAKGLIIVWKFDAQHGAYEPASPPLPSIAPQPLSARTVWSNLRSGAWEPDSPAAWRQLYQNRRKSRVCSLAWSADGEQLCVVHAEGVVYSYHVSGNQVGTYLPASYPTRVPESHPRVLRDCPVLASEGVVGSSHVFAHAGVGQGQARAAAQFCRVVARRRVAPRADEGALHGKGAREQRRTRRRRRRR